MQILSAAERLSRLRVGDLIHGTSAGGASLLLLVTDLVPRTIVCRRITNGDTIRFSPETGRAQGSETAWIDSIAPLPPEIHGILMHFERRYRLDDLDRLPEKGRLSEDEKRALRFVAQFYPANSLHDAGAQVAEHPFDAAP